MSRGEGNPSRISVRRAGAEDVMELAEMLTDFYSHHARLLGSPPKSLEWGRSTARETLSDESSVVLILEESGRVVGFARLQEHEGAVFLREIYVRPERRGRGLGRLLLKEAEREAYRRWGVDSIFLSVIPANDEALDFFVSAGYDFLNTIELTRWEGGANSDVAILGRLVGARLRRATGRLRELVRGGRVLVRAGEHCVARLEEPVEGAFAVVRDGRELTVVARRDRLPDRPEGDVECGFRLLTFSMELPFNLVGFMAAVSDALAHEGVSLLVFSSYSTDHILVKEGDLQRAIRALERLGFVVEFE